jgi:hypothetical protein
MKLLTNFSQRKDFAPILLRSASPRSHLIPERRATLQVNLKRLPGFPAAYCTHGVGSPSALVGPVATKQLLTSDTRHPFSARKVTIERLPRSIGFSLTIIMSAFKVCGIDCGVPPVIKRKARAG